uniref:Enoyl-hydratase n=1 Tax=Colletotrichum fructicola (strain Nara gc5) TaxID=1213859 RepID=L2FPR0_COLFN
MRFPKLPARAAYIHLNNPARRNALSLEVLEDLRSQLLTNLTSPKSGRLMTLPPFKPGILHELERVSERAAPDSKENSEHSWLVDANAWAEERAALPNVLVLRSSGPVFSSGHDLKQLASLSHVEVKRSFALCAEVMSLIRHSPAPVRSEGRVAEGVERLAGSAGQPMALGKWAFWTQLGINGKEQDGKGGDGYEDAASWAGRVMALHARAADSREGIAAFTEKRKPSWKT